MTPIQAILRKESRQQGALALAMVLFCLLIQMSAFTLSLFEFGNTPDYFAIAVFVTALFTGAAAAISFSGEQDERTFGFLRSLPVSAKSIFLGKAAWVVIGTVCVLLGTLLLAGLWTLLAPEARHGYGRFNFSEITATFGIGILEAFIWGLFWSPRCRSQVHALLATYFCASTAGYFCAIFCATHVRGGSSFAEIYSTAIPLRLAVLAVVAVFAVWGGLRWFEFWKQGPAKVSLVAGVRNFIFGHLPFPKRIQSPFFSLLHQGFRQSQLFLLVGFVSGIGCLMLVFDYRFLARNAGYLDFQFYGSLLVAFSVVYYIVLCGGIFGADQKNDMYRFFGRCGVRPGTLWWSRVVQSLLVALPFGLALVFWLIGGEWISRRVVHTAFWDRFYIYLEIVTKKEMWLYPIPVVATLWLVPFSCGAMLSISVKRMIVAVALTGAASGALLFWMGMGYALFGFSPLWTTLPLCLALLVASRLQAENWIRERTGWRCYVKSLVPFFVTGAVICAAVPAVRVYSIPFISLDEIQAVMDQADLPERLSPAERKALFRDVAANLHKPPEADFSEMISRRANHDFYELFDPRHREIDRYSKEELPAMLREKCALYENEFENGPIFETWAMKRYENNYRLLYSDARSKSKNRHLLHYAFFPWEKYRMLRRYNMFQIIAIEDTNRMPENYRSPKGVAFERRQLDYRTKVALFDDLSWEQRPYASYYFALVAQHRLILVHFALHLWYLEHDAALPETLDELVAENYLKQIPNDPRTGEAMRYVRDFDESQIEKNRHQILYGTKPGWPNLEFGRIGVNEIRVDLKFLPGYDEYGQRPGQ